MATWSLMNADIEWGSTAPASGYVLKAYDAGTTDTIPIAITSAGGSQQATLTTNAQGKFEVSGNEVLPYIDRIHKWALFTNASDATADSNPFAGFYDNVPLFKKDDDSSFAGDDPDLIDTVSAIVIGSDDPDNEQHIEIGPTIIQSKSNQTTAAQININSLGGDVQLGTGVKISDKFIGGWTGSVYTDLSISANIPGQKTKIGEPSTGIYLETGGSVFKVENSTSPVLDVASTTFRVTHPTATTTLTRALSIPDLYSRPVTDANTSITIDATWFGLSTDITVAGATVTLDSDIGNDGDLLEFVFSDTNGGTFAFSTITVRFPETSVVQGKYVLIKKRSSGNYDMIGFR